MSTSLERLPGLAAALLDEHGVAAGDLLVIASNSGSNPVVTEMAHDGQSPRPAPRSRSRASRTRRRTRSASGTVSACTSSRTSRIDNGGAVGDAAIAIEGVPTRVAPTSTVVGAAIANALVAEVAERLARRGIVPEVFTSSNVAGGDAVNERLLRR